VVDPKSDMPDAATLHRSVERDRLPRAAVPGSVVSLQGRLQDAFVKTQISNERFQTFILIL